jgi:hypothetical protein
VSTQSLQQRRAQRQVAILAALAVHDMDDHALAVDIGQLQTCHFGAPHPCAVENHQQRSLEKAAAGIDQACNFFLAQNLGEFPARLGIRQELAKLMSV